jgi:drug/metabolite transporter (DMT)-like permease
MVNAIVCSFLATLLYYQLMRNHKSHLVTALTYSSPIFTLLLAELVSGERPDQYSRWGVILITLGIVVLSQHTEI